MVCLGRDDILGAADISYAEVKTPGWGGSVRISTMTGLAREVWESEYIQSGSSDSVNMRALLVSQTIVDVDGKLVFSAKDIGELAKKSWIELNKVFEASMLLNGMSAKAEDDIKN